MKSFKVALSAIVIAVACFAFTTGKQQKGVGPGCTETLYYFQIVGSQTCDEATELVDFILPVDADFSGTPNELQNTTANLNPYGCQDTQTLGCAKGFRLNQIVLDPVDNKWKPIVAQIPSYRCCVRKPQ